MFRSACIAAACLAFIGADAAQLHQKHQDPAAQATKAALTQFGQSLRVCSAYSTAEALQVFVGDKQTNDPVKYQGCVDIEDAFRKGQRIGFKNDGMNIGAFEVGEVPMSANRLLLVVHNANAGGDDIAFKSHVFSSSYDAQVAMVDLSQEGAPYILTDGKESEKLTTEQVLQLGEGAWQVSQQGTPKGLQGKTGFLFKAGQDYVVMRTGPGMKDVIVFPRVEVPFNGDGSKHKTGDAAKPAPKKSEPKKEGGWTMWQILGALFLFLLLLLLIVAAVMYSQSEGSGA